MDHVMSKRMPSRYWDTMRVYMARCSRKTNYPYLLRLVFNRPRNYVVRDNGTDYWRYCDIMRDRHYLRHIVRTPEQDMEHWSWRMG